jgi:nitrogen fixation protein NifU and related proteins
MAYSEKVIDHYEHPRNVGAFDKADPGVGTGMVGAPACGGSAIASSSLVTEWVKGKTLDQAMEIKNTQIAEELALPPVKIHCSILAEDAIKAAIEDYKNKHGAQDSREPKAA